MTTNIGYTSAPVDFTVSPITFDPGGPTTMVGATVRVDAVNLATGVKIAGTAAVTSANSVRCTFAAGSLPVGRYEIQLLATISGASQVIDPPSIWTIKQGAAP